MHDDLQLLTSSEAAVQACCDSPSLSSAPGSKISHRLLCACVSGCQHLWSARRRQLSCPFQVFAAACLEAVHFQSLNQPVVWNSLPDDLHAHVIVLYKSTFTYLLTEQLECPSTHIKKSSVLNDSLLLWSLLLLLLLKFICSFQHYTSSTYFGNGNICSSN